MHEMTDYSGKGHVRSQGRSCKTQVGGELAALASDWLARTLDTERSTLHGASAHRKSSASDRSKELRDKNLEGIK